MPEKPPMVVQSLIFSKEKFPDKEGAMKWAKEHEYHITKGVDETENSWRIRQRPPEDFDEKSMKTIDIDDGIQAVAGYLKNDADDDDSAKSAAAIPLGLKCFDFALKEMSADAPGEFQGFAAVYGNKDHQGDIIEPGAFSRTGNALEWEVPILWQHDPSRPIGIGKLEDRSRGLHIHGFLNLAVKTAQEAYELMKPRGGFKRGIIRGLSIGYDVVKDTIEEGVRKLKEVKLWEVSVVTFPANARALIGDVKQDDYIRNKIALLDEELKELKSRLVADGFLDPDDVHSTMIGLPSLADVEVNNPDDIHLLTAFSDEIKAYSLLRSMKADD